MLRLNECFDGSFQHNRECQQWLNDFIGVYRNHFEEDSIIKIGAYPIGAAANVTIDTFFRKATDRGLAITIMLTKEEIFLPEIDMEQMDICLPGLLDAFFLARLMAGNTLTIQL